MHFDILRVLKVVFTLIDKVLSIDILCYYATLCTACCYTAQVGKKPKIVVWDVDTCQVIAVLEGAHRYARQPAAYSFQTSHARQEHACAVLCAAQIQCA
jgi:hypothetical protein